MSVKGSRSQRAQSVSNGGSARRAKVQRYNCSEDIIGRRRPEAALTDASGSNTSTSLCQRAASDKSHVSRYSFVCGDVACACIYTGSSSTQQQDLPIKNDNTVQDWKHLLLCIKAESASSPHSGTPDRHTCPPLPRTCVPRQQLVLASGYGPRVVLDIHYTTPALRRATSYRTCRHCTASSRT